jgi:hypothetical protein
MNGRTPNSRHRSSDSKPGKEKGSTFKPAKNAKRIWAKEQTAERTSLGSLTAHIQIPREPTADWVEDFYCQRAARDNSRNR